MIVIGNAVLALVVALVIISTLNHMERGKTPCAVMFSMVLIFAGMLGQGTGVLIGYAAKSLNIQVSGWDHFVDTLLYGGLLAFVVACRRFPVLSKAGKSVDRKRLLDTVSMLISAATLIASLALIP